MPHSRPDLWIYQAQADLDAGRGSTAHECHQRYWLQQACEKAIKALGIIIWNRPPALDGLFGKYFLHKHSPLAHLRHELNQSTDADLVKHKKAFTLLLQQIESELRSLDGGGLLLSVDSTTPTTKPNDVSYRYPFRDSSNNVVAPRDWTITDWDAYQGNAMGVVRAVERFLHVVANRLRVNKRAP
jgi:hypothetical protein